jgi:hypothetical protein
MEPEGSLLFLQEPATGSYPEPEASSTHLPILLSNSKVLCNAL